MAGATPLGVAAEVACARGGGALEGAGATGGAGKGASAFAAMGGWLGGSGAAATMAVSFTNADGETSLGGAPESSAGAFGFG
jgi:hypothetical protein